MRREIYKNHSSQWIDVSHPQPGEIAQLQKEFNLHQAMIQDTLDPVHLPKFEKLGQVTFAIIRIFDVDSEADSDTVESLTRKIAIFIGPNFIITVHRLDQEFVDSIFEPCFLEIQSQIDSGDVSLHLILAKFLNRAFRSYYIPLERSESDIIQFESNLFQHLHDAEMFKELHIIRRRLSLIKKILLNSQDVIQRLSPPGEFSSPIFQDLRERVANLNFMTDELLEDATNLLSLHISIASQKTNEVVRILTIFSVFFLPLNLIAGIYGMNFRYIPGLDHAGGHWIAISLMALVTLAILIWFRQKKWM